ncbi:hypothetical protein AK88_01735 [Plasmodium fragile]|uniref:BSD domain-containing protein n=1 Tax=Plasmodium fragile TaxID=5857 RepID=A0A0D9QNK2_PLAFR|nr:uncharacterized protein AK88_01735 [Plasmodium fragile]KJP88655.1 hypothetical protein AK88_01735 [Plasmodium fragile]
MYSLWKEVSEQIKKKAEDLNNSLQEFNSNGNHPLEGSSNEGNGKRQEGGTTQVSPDTSLKNCIQEKFHIINDKYINGKDFPELHYYNEKLLSGFNSFKRIVGDIYKDKLSSGSDGVLRCDGDVGHSQGQKFYLSKIVPWKKGDIMISKIYRKKYQEGFPINLPDPNLNSYVYKKILKLNVDRNKILHTNILQNYNFNWSKKKEQSEKIMMEDPNLEQTKRFLVPFHMSELDFWRSYFFNIDIIYNEIADDIYESRKNFPDSDGPLHFVPLPCDGGGEHGQSPISAATSNVATSHAVTPPEAANQGTPPPTNGKETTVDETSGGGQLTKKLDFPPLEQPAQEETPKEWEKHKENSKQVYQTKEYKEETVAAEMHGTSNLASFPSLNRSDWLTPSEESTEKRGVALATATDGDTPDCNSASEPRSKIDSITPKDDTCSMTKTQINGLNIYMDNDIFVNLRDKSEAFGPLLADTKKHKEKIKREEECAGGYSNVDLVDHSLEASFEGTSNEKDDVTVEGSVAMNRRRGDTIQVDSHAEEDSPLQTHQSINDQLDPLTISKCNIKFLDLIEEQNDKAYSLGKQHDGEAFYTSRDKVERVTVEEGEGEGDTWNGPGDTAVPSEQLGKEEEEDNEHVEGYHEQEEAGEMQKASIHDNLNEAETKEELDDDPNVAQDLPRTHHEGESNGSKLLCSNEGGDEASLHDNFKHDHSMFVDLNQSNTLNEERRKRNENVDPMINVTKNYDPVEEQNDVTVGVKPEGESPRSEKGDTKKSQKECDLYLDELNFSDVLEFDIDSNKFNAEELEQFEQDLLNA